jgi:integrase
LGRAAPKVAGKPPKGDLLGFLGLSRWVFRDEEMPRLTSKPLTQKQIDATSAPATGCTVLRDAEQRGLTLRVWPAGTRAWSFEYRSPVTLKNVRLGVAARSLSEARAVAKGHRAAVAAGRDPALEAKADLSARQEAHARLVTVTDALVRYETAVVEPAAKLASRRKRMRALRGALEPFLARAVASLTRADLIGRLDEVQAASGGVSRNRAQSEIRHFLGWCRDRDLVPSIAIDRVRQAVREQARERVLTDAELSAVLAATADHSAYADLVRTLLHTGVRRGEAATLQPRDLDFEARTITVRGEVSKTRQSRTIPMPDALLDMLRQRARGLARGGYVFGDGTDFKAPFSGFSKRSAALSAAMPEGAERWTLHDIRRTVATRLHEAGADALVVEDLLGHLGGIRSGVAGVYNRATTLPRQREALKAWAEKLLNLEIAGPAPQPAMNIIRLKRARSA